MNERVESILEHMLEDAEDIITFADDVGSLEEFSKDVKTRKAIIMSLLNIGELSNQLPSEYRLAHPEIAWKKMIGLRNVAAHKYQALHFDILWDTTQTTVPELQIFLKSQLQTEEQTDEVETD
jgi:uncharacterized protein with HEPN domain